MPKKLFFDEFDKMHKEVNSDYTWRRNGKE
jgi:hypothetical protein